MAEAERADFMALVEHGVRLYTRKGIDFSFEHRLAGVWKDDGPSTHAAVVPLSSLAERFPEHLDDPSTAWLIPILDRLAAGENAKELEWEAIVEYTAIHGKLPESRSWPI